MIKGYSRIKKTHGKLLPIKKNGRKYWDCPKIRSKLSKMKKMVKIDKKMVLKKHVISNYQLKNRKESRDFPKLG